MRTEKLKEMLGKLVEEVAKENFFYDRLKNKVLTERDLQAIYNEVNSRIALGLIKGFKRATIVYNDEMAIINLYEEIHEISKRGIFGYGFAYNIFVPEFSEWGYLYTP